MNTRKSEVCLLYSESNQATANLLKDALNYYSIDIWEAQNISIGSQIISETTKALEKNKFVIVLWSNTSVKSALLTNLAAEAKKNGKVLISVLIEPVKIPGEFLDIQSANLIGWDGDRENEQIVKLWRLIQDQVLKHRRKKIAFNKFNAIVTLLLTITGLIIAVATPEVRCFLKIQCSENSFSKSSQNLPDINSSSSVLKNPESPLKSDDSLLKSSSNPISNKQPELNTASPIENFTTIERDGLEFTLQKCARKNQNIRCELQLINTLNDDQRLIVYGNFAGLRSRILDLDGITYFAESVEIDGNVEKYAKTTLIPKVKNKLIINFTKVPAQVNQIQVLEIAAAYGGSNKNIEDARFRNIVISN
ncbi:toll/interleukin-1 receptor domain-containing protein [Nostoc parmelioides]|uniref:Toll/interleukin-1 receptor domain-containing protein n=1 Tax=Nostoc parmelioides FACHB-3921 TaxID=2692909 RepID=A0ABR8BEP5_9NOSO|nr:toll/interleukin-1 receptor domain-containing protein [Nostoc parmelioides]MBD2252557.1 toll/interleukin-1 receptor domain-containing protein [Nostoc parmelioides FACHB-3921]